MVTERGQVKARCYSSVHRLVSAQVTAFLTMSDVVGYTLNNRTSAGKLAKRKVKSVRCGFQTQVFVSSLVLICLLKYLWVQHRVETLEQYVVALLGKK